MAETDLIRFQNAQVITGGSAINKRTGAPVGRPRTREPRQPRIIPVWLEAAELKVLNAKPIAALPLSEAEKAIPPFQRLSLAKQIEITYRQQQPRVTQKKANKRDRLVHTEQVLNWRVEVWKKGASRGTDKPLFFYRTECLTVGAVGGSKGKGRFEYATPQRCLDAGRYKVRERETQWRKYGRPTSRKRRRLYSFRVYARRYSLPAEAKALDQPLTVADLLRDEATCPICHRTVDRNRYSLTEHFQRHVSKGLLKLRQVDELLSFLVIPQQYESNVIGA